MEVLELSQMLHPGLFLGIGPQFFLNRLGDELAQGNASFGGHRLGAAEQEIGNLEGRLHIPILPYLWAKPGPVMIPVLRIRRRAQ
jgi:hypothetical protein